MTTSPVAPVQPVTTTGVPPRRVYLSELIERIERSPSGARMLDAIRSEAGMPRIEEVGDAEMDRLGGPGLAGSYSPVARTVRIRSSLLAGDGDEAVLTLTHELRHHLDWVTGATLATEHGMRAAYEDGGLTGRQLERRSGAHAGLVIEARAWAFESQVARELAIAPPAGSRMAQVTISAPDASAAFGAAWARLAAVRDLDPGDFPRLSGGTEFLPAG